MEEVRSPSVAVERKDRHRAQWIDFDRDGLRVWYLQTGLRLRSFIRQNRAEIDSRIDRLESETGVVLGKWMN